MKQWSQKQFFNIQKFQFNILKISLQSYKYLRHEKYFFEKMAYIMFIVLSVLLSAGMKNFISVLADKKIEFIGLYRYQSSNSLIPCSSQGMMTRNYEAGIAIYAGLKRCILISCRTTSLITTFTRFINRDFSSWKS